MHGLRYGFLIVGYIGLIGGNLWCSRPADGAIISKQGVSWDTDWLPTTAKLVHSPVANPTVENPAVFGFGSAWSPSKWITGTHKTVGELLVGQIYLHSGGNRSVNLGPGIFTGNTYNASYTEIELGWGENQGFRNSTGNDLAIYENGYPSGTDNNGFLRGGSDVFLVSLAYIQNGEVMWTGYRYQKPSNYEPDAKWVDNNNNNNDGNFGETPSWGPGPTYLTLIDASDYGIAKDARIVGVRIRNAVWFRDWVTNGSGQGWVTLDATYSGTGGTYPFRDTNGSIIDYYYHPKYGTPEFRYDPDITVVVPLRKIESVHSPEPTVVVALFSGMGTFLLLNRHYRRKRFEKSTS